MVLFLLFGVFFKPEFGSGWGKADEHHLVDKERFLEHAKEVRAKEAQRLQKKLASKRSTARADEARRQLEAMTGSSVSSKGIVVDSRGDEQRQ